jgi:hypothetical protein
MYICYNYAVPQTEKLNESIPPGIRTKFEKYLYYNLDLIIQNWLRI